MLRRMKIRLLLTAAVLSLTSVAACAKTGNVTEKTPVTQDLGVYRTASISVDVPKDVKNSDKHQSTFGSALADKLKSRHLFEVAPDGGDLVVKVKVTSVDDGSAVLRGLGSGSAGDAKVAATVDLFDTKQSKSVGSFDVVGNSSKNFHSSVGGVDTAAIEDATGRAIGAAADQIADFLEKHRAAK